MLSLKLLPFSSPEASAAVAVVVGVVAVAVAAALPVRPLLLLTRLRGSYSKLLC